MFRYGVLVTLLISACIDGEFSLDEDGETAKLAPSASPAPAPHLHRIRSLQGISSGSVDRVGPVPADSINAMPPNPPDNTNGIDQHDGPVMGAPVNVYYIWYGNWSGNTATTILSDLANSIGNSPYWNINTTYYDTHGAHVTSTVRLAGSTTDAYSRGTNLTDTGVAGVVSDAITSGRLPADSAGVYFVLTSADVGEPSGFCTSYCGWHTSGTIAGLNIKYSFVGDPVTRCPSFCMEQPNGPNNNGGADAMASVIAHELDQSTSDPNLNTWFTLLPGEKVDNADHCSWEFGRSLYRASNGTLANVQLGSRNYLLQQNWVNAEGGYCAMASNYEWLAGILTSSPAVASPTPGQLDAFVRDTNNALKHIAYNGVWGTWGEPLSPSGFLTSEPAAVSSASGRIDVFARGSDNLLKHRWFDGRVWSTWESPNDGMFLGSGPAVSSRGPGRLDVFAKGTDNALHHTSFDNGVWSPWEWLGGILTSEPAAVSWSSGRIDVFVRGTDNALWQIAYNDGGGWSGWVTLGGKLATGPAAASWAPGRLDVFAGSVDNTLLHIAYGGSWSGFESLGNTTLSSPAAVSWSPGRIDVFMMGEGGALFHKWYNGSWGP